MRKSSNSFKKILIVNPFGIGDLLFSTPLAKNLKYYYPNSRIIILTAKRSMPVVENNLDIDEVIGFNRGDYKELKKKSKAKAYRKAFAVLGKIISFRPDIYIDLSLEHRYSLVPAVFGVKPRIGYNYKKRGRFLTDKLDIGSFAGKHVVEYHLHLLRFLGIKPRFKKLGLYVSAEEREWAKGFLRKRGAACGQRLIGVAAGGKKSWGKKAGYLQWPAGKFAELAGKLAKDKKNKIILLGDSSDSAVCERIYQKLEGRPINACGSTNLRQFFALLAECNIVICNDTGILHAASALGKKIVCLCGPVDEKVYGPYPPSEDKAAISKDFPCRPCYNNFRVPECRYNHRCLEAISRGEVLEEVENLLFKSNLPIKNSQ